MGLGLGWLLFIPSMKISKIEGIFHHLYIMLWVKEK